MGNSGEKIQGKFKSIYYKTKSHKSSIGKNVSCPTCGRVFNSKTTYNTLNVHLDSCLQSGGGNAMLDSAGPGLVPPGVDKGQVNHDSFAQNMMTLEEQVFIWKKMPLEGVPDEYKWTKIPFKEITNYADIKVMSAEKIKPLSFEEKEVWFRYQMEKIRVPWTEGSSILEVSREHIVRDTYKNLDKFNLYKEIKISFKEEKVLDAGGLMREWIHLINLELFKTDEDRGMFSLTNTPELAYRLNPNFLETAQADAADQLRLFGKILGKCIFERIPLGVSLDRSLIKHLLNKEITREDLKFSDLQLASSFDFILNNPIDEINDIEEYFVIYRKTPSGKMTEVELKPEGKTLKVNDKNKKEYVDLYVDLLTTKLVKANIELIKEGFNKESIEVFTPVELEMIISGLPFIDIDEWEENTEYKGAYYKNHQVVKWFWACLREFDQKKLSRFLKFCTGSSRVPIEGFRLLESNRGKISKFCLESSKFSKENPFPRAHTCFNRLDLPMYPSVEVLKQHVLAVADNSLEGMFGME